MYEDLHKIYIRKVIRLSYTTNTCTHDLVAGLLPDSIEWGMKKNEASNNGRVLKMKSQPERGVISLAFVSLFTAGKNDRSIVLCRAINSRNRVSTK